MFGCIATKRAVGLRGIVGSVTGCGGESGMGILVEGDRTEHRQSVLRDTRLGKIIQTHTLTGLGECGAGSALGSKKRVGRWRTTKHSLTAPDTVIELEGRGVRRTMQEWF